MSVIGKDTDFTIGKCPLLEKTRILPIVDQARSQEIVMGGEGGAPNARRFLQFFNKITHF